MQTPTPSPRAPHATAQVTSGATARGLARDVLSDAGATRSTSASVGSAASAPLSHASTRSANAGPCLKPCPEPPPSDPHARVLGVGRGDEPVVGGQLVLAAAVAEQRRVDQRRETPAQIAADVLLHRPVQRAVAGVGVEVGADGVGGRLDPAAVEVALAVERALVVQPRGDLGRAPGLGRGEVEDVLLGHAQVDHVREQRGQPRPAGPDDVVGLERLVADAHALAVGRGQAADETRPALAGGVGQRAGGPARAQHAGLGLVQHVGEVGRAQGREERRARRPARAARWGCPRRA